MNITDFLPSYRHPPARVVRVLDGDTIEVELPLPCDVRYRATLRLIGIDAPEMHGPDRIGAEAARLALETLVLYEPVYVETFKERRSFIRYTAHVYIDANRTGELVSVSDAMLASGLVVPWP